MSVFRKMLAYKMGPPRMWKYYPLLGFLGIVLIILIVTEAI